MVGHEHVRVLVGLVAVVAFFGITFGTLLPAWAVDVLGGDATTNGFLQSARGVDALRGRVMGIYSLAFFGFMPLGGLAAGALADHIGAPLTVALAAAVVLLVAAAVRAFQPGLSRLP